MGKNKIENIELNSIKDNKKFDINAVEILYSLPVNTITLINDEKDNIYLARINSFKDIEIRNDEDNFKNYIIKQKTNNKKSDILKSYDLFLNNKYKVVLNQKTIERVKNFLMKINRSFKDFKFRHRNKKNQILYTSKKVKNDEEVLNLIDNFLKKKIVLFLSQLKKGK